MLCLNKVTMRIAKSYKVELLMGNATTFWMNKKLSNKQAKKKMIKCKDPHLL